MIAVDEDREAHPDWVVTARLFWGDDPQCTPASSEFRLAVWLLLDAGFSRAETCAHLGLETRNGDVARIARWRTLAAKPDRKGHARRGGALLPQEARKLGPTPQQRTLLHLGIGILASADAAMAGSSS